MALTVGTAGHVDHGKTTLVRALTGKDTDRLPEEQARGISIDLGYAPLTLPDGTTLSLVDVPGHERFVRTMVAGATGIDLFLLVVDAAEGARAQTHEHLAVLRLLGVEHGVVAVTKADLVDDETLALAIEEARELVPGAPVVAVSGGSGTGLDELRSALVGVAAQAEQRRADFPTRLFVDRVFTLHGIGTVVTGTLWSGTVGEGDVLRVEPRGFEARVRSVQVHDRPVERGEGLVLPSRERLPAGGRVEDAGVVGEAPVRLVHQPQGRLRVEGVAKPLRLEVPLPGRRRVRLARLAADREHRGAGLRRACVPASGGVAEEHDRPGGRIERLPVELERRAAGEHDVHLLVSEALLRVALDDVVAGPLGGVRVHAERLDAERAPDRPPAKPARDRDRLHVGDPQRAPALVHARDAIGTATVSQV